MEFDSKSTKYLFYTLVVAMVTVVVFAFHKIIQSENKSEARYEANRAACLELNATYGDTLSTKEGPYRGVVMKAYKFDAQTVTVRIDGDPDTYRFECTDLIKVKY